MDKQTCEATDQTQHDAQHDLVRRLTTDAARYLFLLTDEKSTKGGTASPAELTVQQPLRKEAAWTSRQ